MIDHMYYDDWRRAMVAVEMAEGEVARLKTAAESVERLWLGLGPAPKECPRRRDWSWGGSTAD